MSATATPHPVQSAAEYVRMSTDLQCYSIKNQQACIREYATRNGLEIVRTYADGGRSGLGLQNRKGLQSLLADVISGSAPFDFILVYDVSRWGRFQDTDEAAHYEFICRRAGKRLIYCAEPFANDCSAMTSIIKGLKRVMAGEYSRELSDKVHRGQSRFATMGFHVGARAAYGMRRMLIGSDGTPRGLLEFGQRKAMQNERVILVPGPDHEVKVVRQIYDWFNSTNSNYQDIADRLNFMKVLPPPGSPHWNRYQVKSILSNVKYLGTMVYNRTSSKLSTPKVRNARSAWIEVPDAFESIITRSEFEEAAVRRAENPRKHRREYLIAYLKKLLDEHGYLSGMLLRRLKSGPAPGTYVSHFGSIDAAFAAVGYDGRLNDPRQSVRRHGSTRIRLNLLVQWFISAFEARGLNVRRESLCSLRIDDSYRLTITLPLCFTGGKLEQIHLDKKSAVVIAISDNALDGSCIVLDPQWYPHRTISLSSIIQIEKVSQWKCTMNEAPGRAIQILGYVRKGSNF